MYTCTPGRRGGAGWIVISHFSAGSRFPSNTNLTSLKGLGEHSQLSSHYIGLRHETRGTLQVYSSVHWAWVSKKTANLSLVIKVN